MKIIVGKNSGFCFGVRRAISGTEEQVEKYGKIKCLGHLVHNEIVTKELEEKGVTFINDISEAESNSVLIIRAHGVSEKIYKQAKMKNIKLIDYTCPKVCQIHNKIKDAADKGYQVILIGKKEHPEVIGSKGYASNVIILDNVEDVENLKDYEKVFVIVQTTFSYDKYKLIESALAKRYKNIEFVNSICESTKSRQEECKKIAEQVDFMIIIGGIKSSNTQKLYEVARKINKNSIMIQDENDEKINECKKHNSIGIMSGASTPNYVVSNLVKKLENL